MPVKFPSLLFFSADNRWHVPCRDWSRWALRLRRLDSVACGYSRDQRINTPCWWILSLANKAGVHSRAEWHTALCILYVCRGTILCGWSDCSLHDYHVPKCLLWGNWRAYNHRHNIHSGATLHQQGIVTVLSCKVRCQPYYNHCLHAKVWLLYFIQNISKRRKLPWKYFRYLNILSGTQLTVKQRDFASPCNNFDGIDIKMAEAS